jgi:3-hydroxybutyrate dehydrogenase
VINDVLLKGQPTKQFVTVDQVAALALFLCSDAASQITGTNLSMDGGWTAEYGPSYEIEWGVHRCLAGLRAD